MKYIFDTDCECSIGKLPIENIQVAWYDMTQDGICFDESFIEPQNFGAHDLMYICTEDNKNDHDKSRVFVNLTDGRTYELILKKV